jgi:hypothetical protein
MDHLMHDHPWIPLITALAILICTADAAAKDQQNIPHEDALPRCDPCVQSPEGTSCVARMKNYFQWELSSLHHSASIGNDLAAHRIDLLTNRCVAARLRAVAEGEIPKRPANMKVDQYVLWAAQVQKEVGLRRAETNVAIAKHEEYLVKHDDASFDEDMPGLIGSSAHKAAWPQPGSPLDLSVTGER